MTLTQSSAKPDIKSTLTPSIEAGLWASGTGLKESRAASLIPPNQRSFGPGGVINPGAGIDIDAAYRKTKNALTGEKAQLVGKKAQDFGFKIRDALTGERAKNYQARAGKTAGNLSIKLKVWAEQADWRRLGIKAGGVVVIGGIAFGAIPWWLENGWRYSDPDMVELNDWNNLHVSDYVGLTLLSGKFQPITDDFTEGLALADMCPHVTRGYDGSLRIRNSEKNAFQDKKVEMFSEISAQENAAIELPYRLVVKVPVSVNETAGGAQALDLASLKSQIVIQPRCSDILPDILPKSQIIKLLDTDHRSWLQSIALPSGTSAKKIPVFMVVDIRSYSDGAFWAVPVGARMEFVNNKVQYAGFAETPDIKPKPTNAKDQNVTSKRVATTKNAPNSSGQWTSKSFPSEDWVIVRPVNEEYFATGSSKIRSAPTTNGDVVGTLMGGGSVMVEGETDQTYKGKPWFKIQNQNTFIWSGLLLRHKAYLAQKQKAKGSRLSNSDQVQAILDGCKTLQYEGRPYCKEIAEKIRKGQDPTKGLKPTETESAGRYAVRGPWGSVTWRLSNKGKAIAHVVQGAPKQNIISVHEIKTSFGDAFGGIFSN